MRRLAFVFLIGLSISVVACDSQVDVPQPPKPGNFARQAPATITIEEAMQAVQRVPGGKAYALGVASPDEIYQDTADEAQVQMLLNGESLRMSFKRTGGQWEWVAASSPKWQPLSAKSPAETLAWMAANRH